MSQRLRIAALAILFTATVSGAQDQTFRAGVALVTIDVTVLDKDGKPVPGLSSEDFEIKLNGKVQPVRAIAFLQAASTSAAQPATDATSVNKPASNQPAADAPKPAAIITAKQLEVRRTISNQDNLTGTITAPANPAPAAPAAPAATNAPAPRIAGNIEPRVFVILIDDLSFPATRGKALFASAQKFVDTVPASDPVGFTTTSSSMTVNPTLDRAAVKAGLAKAVGEFNDPRDIRKGGMSGGFKGGAPAGKDGPIGMDEAIDIDRGDDTLLMSVIVRECFLGDANAVRSLSLQQVLAGIGVPVAQSSCASDVASEAKRTAALLRQTKGRQLAALTGVLNAMRPATGIRHLVYVTDGMAVSRDVVDLKPITSTAAAAGVQFSVIMEDPDSINMSTMGRFVPTQGPGASSTK
jgi:VWFA-related protein